MGELSSSALSTATAVTALTLAGLTGSPNSDADLKSRIAAGLDWLAAHANPDGGWGDTVRSLSNLSTTTLVWAAFGVVGGEAKHRPEMERGERWIVREAGSLEPDTLAEAVIARYGKDRTFSVPILTMCALAGRLGPGPEAWRHVIPLPFELAACPHQWFAALKLPVVSYALPALIAIGLVRHHRCPSRNPIARLLRILTRARTLKILTTIQPVNGGFLEATPLTSFVVMSLAGCGEGNHPVARRGVLFLCQAQREDGSWPIDTNLATWLTTLAIEALPDREMADAGFTRPIRSWLLAQQYRVEHPYTHAAPGGWAWTDLPGGVPDADDTAGALIALRRLGAPDESTRQAAIAGTRWLLSLQNRDGGIPTFCRGWGSLPFDRSSADITAHALRAWRAWQDDLPSCWQLPVRRATRAALKFLCRSQCGDGSWVPLWFGNQSGAGEENPVYGTARVLQALCTIHQTPENSGSGGNVAAERALRWLLAAQGPEGSWGAQPSGPSSVEETALALDALAWTLLTPGLLQVKDRERVTAAVIRGTNWLVEKSADNSPLGPAPIGFYFAKLWYFEKLYPLIFTVGALRRVQEALPQLNRIGITT